MAAERATTSLQLRGASAGSQGLRRPTGVRAGRALRCCSWRAGSAQRRRPPSHRQQAPGIDDGVDRRPLEGLLLLPAQPVALAGREAPLHLGGG